MGQMKELFIQMQEGLMQGITIANAHRERKLEAEEQEQEDESNRENYSTQKSEG